MLEPLKHILQAERVILASGSPRRKEVLKNIGLKFEVVTSLFEENLDPLSYKDPADFVIDTALHKVEEVADRLKQDNPPPGLIIGADTVVVMDGHVHGKPASREEAFSMLQKFSGKSHFVYTGIVLQTRNQTVKFFERTQVYMAELTPDVIQAYIDTGEPMDKAGGYGIQGIGGTLVKSVVGDYFNIVGFPVHHFCVELLKLFKPQQT